MSDLNGSCRPSYVFDIAAGDGTIYDDTSGPGGPLVLGLG